MRRRQDVKNERDSAGAIKAGRKLFGDDSAAIGLSMILYMILLNGLTLLLRAAARPLAGVPPNIHQIISGLAEVLAYTLTFVFTVLFMSKGAVRPAGFSNPGTLFAALTVPLFFVTFLLLNYINIFVKELLSYIGVFGVSPSIIPPKSGASLLVFLLMYVLLPPVLEELLFRGVLLFRLRRFGDGFAVALSSFIFALMHHNLVSMPGIFLTGLLFGYLTILSGSLVPAMLMHLLNNSIAVLFLWFERYKTPAEMNMLASAVFLAGITSFALICMYAVVFMLQRREPRQSDAAVLTARLFQSRNTQIPARIAFARAFRSGWMIAFTVIAVFITLYMEFLPRLMEQATKFRGS